MKQVADLYDELVNSRRVIGIRRYNLRRFCRSFDLPPCGISFWLMDDLNWDYLRTCNAALKDDRFWFQGGEHFPRVFWNHIVLGQEQRTEFVFLNTSTTQHKAWAVFLAAFFSDCAREFGQPAKLSPAHLAELRPQLQTGLLQDLIHFGERTPAQLGNFYLSLILLTRMKPMTGAIRELVAERFREQYPEFKADITRILTTRDIGEQMEDILHLISKLP